MPSLITSSMRISSGTIRMELSGFRPTSKGLIEGRVKAFGDHEVVRETAASQVVDAKRALGVPMAKYAMEWSVARAKERTFGAMAVHQSGHIGRLGAYPPMAAKEDCIGLVLLNGGGPFAAPFGGTAQRLPPNPISISAPTAEGAPLMLDMTTSMVAGGKVSLYHAVQEPVPPDWLIGEDGEPVTDTNLFYEKKAAMLPVGGSVGHKGYGLAVMIDAIAGGLSWAGCTADPPTQGGSGFLTFGHRHRELHRCHGIQTGNLAPLRMDQILSQGSRSGPDLSPGRDRGSPPKREGSQRHRNRRGHLGTHSSYRRRAECSDAKVTARNPPLPPPLSQETASS